MDASDRREDPEEEESCSKAPPKFVENRPLTRSPSRSIPGRYRARRRRIGHDDLFFCLNWHLRPKNWDLAMKTGIIGLPQVGKTSLFRILTKANLSEHAFANPREAHIGVAKVPDERLDKLAALYHPKKLTHASVEYVDVGAIGQDALKETAYIGHLRQVDALIHVLRAFENDEIPHVGPIDLIVIDLGQIEKRLERLEKDLKKMKTPELEKENELLIKAKAFLETEKPLREMEMTPDDKKRIRGFMFLSEKPMLYVLNIGESTELGKDLEAAVGKYKLTEVSARPNAGASAICGKVEAELAEMSDEDAAEFLGSYGLTESGLARLIRKSYHLLGLISFFTA